MFTRLAEFRPFEPQRVAAPWDEAMHSNDNLPGRRRPAGERRSPPPALACHWYLNDRDGRLECRWEVVDLEEVPADRVRDGLPKSRGEAVRGSPFVSARGRIKDGPWEACWGRFVENRSELRVSSIRLSGSTKS